MITDRNLEIQADQIPRHYPGLDGLRGIAILSVMLYHYELNCWPWHQGPGRPFWLLLSSGWMGVDLFFVLSGFLISGILLDTRQSSRYYYNFYARRTLRIFPLYYVYLIGFMLVGPWLLGMTPISAATQMWLWFYLSNVRIALGGFSAIPGGLQHCWSLAIEEQFYLVWPAIIRLIRPARLLWVCVGLFALCLFFRILCRVAPLPWTFPAYFTLTRVDAFAVGAFIACVFRSARFTDLTRITRWLSPALVIAILGLWLWRGENNMEDKVVATLGLSLYSLYFASLLVQAIQPAQANRVAQLCYWQGFRFLGRYSYALYMFHRLVAHGLREHGFVPDHLEALGVPLLGAHGIYLAGNLVASLGVSMVSWHLLEKHFLRLKQRFA